VSKFYEQLDSRLKWSEYAELIYAGKGKENYTHQFTVMSGSLHLSDQPEKSGNYRFYQYFLVNTRAAAAIFQLNDLKYTTLSGFQAELDYDDRQWLGPYVAFADILELKSGVAILSVKCQGNCGFRFTNEKFRLVPRLYDPNTKRILDALSETEEFRISRRYD
jgi:hypothetical protein